MTAVVDKKIRIKIGVIGAGHLGKHHIKHLCSHPSVNFVGFFDSNKEVAKKISKKFSVKSFENVGDLISSSDGLHIVTPTNLHHSIAMDCLKKNKDIFIEKPIASNIEEAEEIVSLSKKNKNIVQVGHVERFNPTINRLKTIIKNPHFIEIERLAPFQSRGTEVPVVLDLMVHDIDLVLSMVDSNIKQIQASGAIMMGTKVDVAHARIEFYNGVIANLKSSRIAQNYVRKIRTYEKNLYTITDLMIPQIETYNIDTSSSLSSAGILGTTASLTEKEVETADGIKKIYYDKIIPEKKDALLEEINNFIDCIHTRSVPVVDGTKGLKALGVALEIEEKITKNG
ncbi:MAG TPA: Gfo/Idh/MocA family oxidoreductase [Candidatus Marinimicrobia bacterium]|nr:Gfo/Idh/MocA family oxidoreductase [Candidatus Neomarinimicrobiota bacterium]